MNEKVNQCGRIWRHQGGRRRTCKGFRTTFISCKFYEKDLESNADEWCKFYNNDYVSNIGDCLSPEAIADAELIEKLEQL